jgi:hypothetical protein
MENARCYNSPHGQKSNMDPIGLSILVNNKYGFAPSAHLGSTLSSILGGRGGGGPRGETSSLSTSGPAGVDRYVAGVEVGRYLLDEVVRDCCERKDIGVGGVSRKRRRDDEASDDDEGEAIDIDIDAPREDRADREHDAPHSMDAILEC